MIPPYDDHGFLPPGVHPASLDEAESRFGCDSEVRRAQMDSVKWMVELAVRAGVQRIILNGSFVTDVLEPNDVDCVLLIGPGARRDRRALKQLRKGLPFLSIALVGQDDFDHLVNDFFANDRFGVPKGMIEVVR
ncbi:MAG TPA: hypothetical protein VGY55_12610 [Pirellulales bacterium]|nr:hypothetical protein [Pirellulales bacterium]